MDAPIFIEPQQDTTYGDVLTFSASLSEFEKVGCTRMYFQMLDLKDLDHLSDLAEVLEL